MMCAGKIYCKIYREKRYCGKTTENKGEYQVCDCRHAMYKCEIGNCVFDEDCPNLKTLKR